MKDRKWKDGEAEREKKIPRVVVKPIVFEIVSDNDDEEDDEGYWEELDEGDVV